MDFSEIAGMNHVIDYITNNKNLSRFEYRVWVYPDDKDRSITKQPINKIRFGNTDERESIDYVNIYVYKDKATLHCIPEGAKNYEVKIDPNKKISLEQNIIFVLDAWRSYYLN